MSKRTQATYPNLRTWREAKELNQRMAAVKFGISQAGYAKIELGRRHPRPKLLKKMLRETGVPIEVLVGVAV